MVLGAVTGLERGWELWRGGLAAVDMAVVDAAAVVPLWVGWAYEAAAVCDYF